MKTLPRFLVPLTLVLLAAAFFIPAAGAAPKKGSYPGLAPKKIVALVKLRHPRGLNQLVRAVSDPGSPRYRQFLSVDTLVNRYGATEAAQKAVVKWFAERGVEAEVSATGAFAVAEMPARVATRILPPAQGASISAAGLEPAVPVGLRGTASKVTLLNPELPEPGPEPTAGASATPKKGSKKPFLSILPHTGTSTGCGDARTGGHGPGLEPFTPNQYLTAYGHAEMHKRGFKGQGQVAAVVETGGFNKADIATFAKCFGIKAPPIQRVSLGGKPLPPQDETTLDLEMLTAGAPGLKKIYVYEAEEGGLGDLVIATAAALGKPGKTPDVISMSLGICEPDLSGQLAVREAFDNVFAVAAGAGVSVFVSAGDEGSSGCRAFNTATEERTALPLLAVEVPSSSPYATAVGGTNLQLTKQNAIQAEVVWNDSIDGVAGGGGGGTSILSPRSPWWQAGQGNFGQGRKVPDIAALADIVPGYAIFCTAAPPECLNGGPTEPVRGWTSVGGTSAAAPLMASGVLLADQYLEHNGQPNVGFVNPLLYELGAEKAGQNVFNDVTIGNNDIGRALPIAVGGGKPLGCCQALPGYDRASGWGSLKIPGFAAAAASAARD